MSTPLVNLPGNFIGADAITSMVHEHGSVIEPDMPGKFVV
jgi:hypothetical protein